MEKIKEILNTLINWSKKLSLVKKIILLAIVVAAIFVLWPKSKEPTTSYQTQTVKTGSVTQIVSETGEIMSTGKTDVPTTITGIISDVYIKNGESVVKNQALFSVVSSATQEERATAYAAYLRAKNTLEAAKNNQYAYQADMFADWDQFKELAESDDYEDPNSVNRTLPEFHIPEKDWLAAEGKYKTQEQVISQAQTAVNDKRLEYQTTIDGEVKAPIGGTIANLSVASGQEVNTADNALMIVSSGETWVSLSVSEADVIKLSPDQKAEVKVDALNNKTFAATVLRVDQIGIENSGVVTYNAYLLLKDPSPNIRPSMTVQVDITTANQENTLLVPNSAIKPYQGGKAVQIISPKTEQIIYLPIEVGIEGTKNTEITSGLKEGQKIITGQTSNQDQKSKSRGGMFPIPGGH